MTNRPGRDWTPLGYWADPVPGDGSEVQAFADIFRKTETSLVGARDALRPVTTGDMIGVRADNIRWIEIRGHVEQRIRSADGKPFHNGSRWQRSGDLTYQDGRCGSCGKEWGASEKRIRCTCGATVYLT